MTIEIKNPIDQSYIKDLSARNGEPEWFKQLRLDAAKLYDNLPLPKPDKTKIDRWNFTDFKQPFVENQTDRTLDELPEKARALLDTGKEVRNLYVQHNQTRSYLQLSDRLKEQGVIFTDLFTAVREHPELVKKFYMTNAIKVDEHRLTAFHAALVNGGLFLYVPKNVVIEEPVQAIFIHDNGDAPLINHVLIVADESSSVTYVENYLSLDEEIAGVANILTEVVALDNARVQFGAVDNLAKGMTTYVNRRGYAERDARIDWALGSMNDGDTIFENITNLIGDGSYSDAKLVVVSRGKQTQNFTTEIINHGKRSEGFILGHGVVKDEATAILNGIGRILDNAVGANSQQENRVLMLSERARGDANPILLIEEGDVYAGHAASVGRVDPIQLFYLMSRGITREEAERLIIFGFLAPVVNELPIEAVKKQLVQVIEGKVR